MYRRRCSPSRRLCGTCTRLVRGAEAIALMDGPSSPRHTSIRHYAQHRPELLRRSRERQLRGPRLRGRLARNYTGLVRHIRRRRARRCRRPGNSDHYLVHTASDGHPSAAVALAKVDVAGGASIWPPSQLGRTEDPRQSWRRHSTAPRCTRRARDHHQRDPDAGPRSRGCQCGNATRSGRPRHSLALAGGQPGDEALGRARVRDAGRVQRRRARR